MSSTSTKQSIAQCKASLNTEDRRYLKLILKTPDKRKFKQQKVPDLIEGVGIDQPHYTIKGRNVCKKAIVRQIGQIEALAKAWHGHFRDIKQCLNAITFMIHILNGNRLGAEKYKNKVKSHNLDLLDRAMFPTEGTKYGGAMTIDKDGKTVQIAGASDNIPEQFIIDIGKEGTETLKYMNWLIERIHIISKVY